jgi:acyl-CoA thioesterase
MSNTFEAASRLVPGEAGRLKGSLDASWGQGRALFGGIQAALLVRACDSALADPARQLRTLSVGFCRATEAGELEAEARLEREGRYISHLSARLIQGGEVVATALAAYARDRDDSLSLDYPAPPELPPPEELPTARPNRFIPAFLQHFDMRFVPGTAPYSASDVAEARGWVRFAEPAPLGAAAMAALLDVWPPAVLTMLSPPRSSASVDLRYDVLQPLPIEGAAADDFYAFRCRILHWRAGHGIDEGELWTRDGRPVARIRQLRAIF